MSQSKADAIETTVSSQPLITEEKFQLLREAQRRIADATGISPTVRIVINKLINSEQLSKVENGLIKQFQQINTL